jgi:predicted amidophosphoribosyltransferase
MDKRGNMSLIKCPSCDKDVSKKAAACPHCGLQIKYPGRINLKDPVHIFGIIIVIGIIVSVILYIMLVT